MSGESGHDPADRPPRPPVSATGPTARSRARARDEGGAPGPAFVVECDDALLWAGRSTRRFDALIMDPPYCSGAVAETARTAAKGQGRRSENLARFGWFVGDNMGTAGLVWLLRAVAHLALRRLLRETGHLLCFCDWRQVPNLAPAIESAGLRYQNQVVWDKGSMGLGVGFRTQHETILHFTAGAPEYHHKGIGNVIRAARVPLAEQEHHTEKPVELLLRLVEVVTPPGGEVLDLFCGSGSTGEAALRAGRRFVGVDADPAYAEKARRRLEGVAGRFERRGGEVQKLIV